MATFSVFSRAEQRINLFDVGAGQRRSRLVEDEKLRLLTERFGDLDHLAARERQIAHAEKRIDVFTADFREQRFGPATLSARVNQTETSGRRGDRNVVRDREVRHQ